MPILSRGGFYDRLPSIHSTPSSGFIRLCLCIKLVTENPAHQGLSMQTSLYITIKSLVSLLEPTTVVSLETIHARLLLTLYEVGHAIQPAASIFNSSSAVKRAIPTSILYICIYIYIYILG
jgi:hypothetical protein